jgi:LPXTG-motif cell wall-anchored protein
MASKSWKPGWIGFVVVFCFQLTAEAKLFRNAYLQFELPEQWNCILEGTEWVCSSSNKESARESIIILTAKEVGPQDSMATYETHLKTPRQVKMSNGKTSVSQVKNIRTRKINEHLWVDALHLGSEIPGYYTRYVATLKDKLAILVTFSAHQKHYTKYSNDFFKAVESLRVTASKDLLTPRGLAPMKPTGEGELGTGINTSFPSAEEAPSGTRSGSEGPDPVLLGGIGLLLAGLGLYLWKKRNS